MDALTVILGMSVPAALSVAAGMPSAGGRRGLVVFRVFVAIAHAAALAWMVIATMRLPRCLLNDARGMMVLLVFFTLSAAAWADRRFASARLAAGILGVLAIAVLPAGIIFHGGREVPLGRLGLLLAFHVFASVLGCALLAVACAAGLLFVWRRKSLKAGGPGGMDGGWPALTALDGLFVRATGWGMIFLTAGMVLGAFRIPGTEGHDAWYADVRTVLSLLGWGLFAVTAIARRRRGFSTPAAVGLGVAGYLLILAGLLARGLGASGFHKF